MKQKHMKKIGSFLLAGAMILTMFPTFHTEVHAAENKLPTKEQFAMKEKLKEFNTASPSSSAKVYFGENKQQWWIVGSQNTDSMTLFSARPLAKSVVFEQNWTANKTYSDDWNCTYTGEAPTDVFPNHYGASPLRNTLKALETSYFTNAEQDLMNDTTIYTDDTKNNYVYSTTNKLYLGYGVWKSSYFTVGKNDPANLNSGLHIDLSYWNESYWKNRFFWLRTPYSSIDFAANAVSYGNSIAPQNLSTQFSLMPAFELNLSDVLFGSTVSAVTSGGTLSTNDAFTLRYNADSLGSALVSYDKSKVTLKNVPENTYLVIQNSSGAWAKKITNETEVSASDMSLENFANCKVWLETTDTTNRMTYATLATEEQGYDVNITASEGLAVTNGTQGVGQGSAITDISVEVANGYFLPKGYIDSIQGLNGLTATETENGFKISGTPTSDVTVTLPAATRKVYSMTVAGNGTFTTVCKDYQPINANEFTITNNGNVDLENVKVSLTGTDANKFELSADNTTTIQPSGTIEVTVKPNNDLAVGTYQATLSVSADNVNTATTDLQFTVNEHDYDKVVTPPTCTEKGYTTYTCKNCSHSYKDDEVAAKGHTFGEWEIITSPSCDQGGSRKHTCKDCRYVETENLNPTGHAWENDYTVDKEPTCTEDGSKSIHCKNCDAVKDSTTIAKLGHSFTKYVSDGNATCTQDGTKTAKCERCNKTDTRVQENSALGHDLGEWKVIKDATTTETGIKERHCTRCDYKETESIPVISKPAQPNDNSSDKDNANADTNKESPKTGDQTNLGLFTVLLSMSALGIAVLTVLKKKKALEHK